MLCPNWMCRAELKWLISALVLMLHYNLLLPATCFIHGIFELLISSRCCLGGSTCYHVLEAALYWLSLDVSNFKRRALWSVLAAIATRAGAFWKGP